ncbi:MAG: 30S ribosomal protein S7 [Deltaproteobacteria bacterium RBG_16_50_11]|nr:MAG: 30S ribosomal protein S7 [Deltaproteobacteria bacterium RBG_16_50_11]
MPRKREVSKREVLPDPKYHDALIAKFINGLMRRGKKSIAEKIFYGALDVIKEKTHSDPVKTFHQAVDNVKPLLEVRPRRVGGATYQVPVEVRHVRKNALAIRWIIGYAKSRSEKTMKEKLSGELIDAANNRGASIKKKDDTHKMAEANKAFAHYRW